MKKIHVTVKANVIPAKKSGHMKLEERVSDGLQTKTLKGKNRMYIHDLCDFCLQPHYLLRWAFMIRVQRRYTFLCFECEKKGKAKWGNGVFLAKKSI